MMGLANSGGKKPARHRVKAEKGEKGGATERKSTQTEGKKSGVQGMQQGTRPWE